MLDYSHNEGDRQSFIFDYKILDSADGEKIAVKYANKKIRIVPYSLVTESEIIKKMHKQAEYALTNFKSTTVEKIGFAAGIGMAGTFVYSIGTQDFPFYAWYFFYFTAGICLGSYIQKKDELKKYRYFLEQEAYINHYLPLTNEHAFSGLNRYSVNKIYDKADRFSSFPDVGIVDIKLVDGMTLRELKTLRGNIDRELCLEPLQEELDTLAQQKVKKQNNVLRTE